MDNPMMGKKYSINSLEPSEEDLKNIKVIKGEETKTILGYVCNEYIVEFTKDGVVLKMKFFTSEKVSALHQQASTFGNDFKGFPMYMEMTINQMGMDMLVTSEVTEIKKEEVSSDKFDMTPPEGYEKMDKLQGM